MVANHLPSLGQHTWYSMYLSEESISKHIEVIGEECDCGLHTVVRLEGPRHEVRLTQLLCVPRLMKLLIVHIPVGKPAETWNLRLDDGSMTDILVSLGKC